MTPGMEPLILALMLSLAPPGMTINSTVVAKQDDARLCVNDNSLLCRKPWMSKRRGTWVLPETKEASLKRYKLIARVINDVSSSTTDWRGSKRELALHLVTVAYHESGFSRDVHDGAWRGDCNRHNVCRSSCLGQILVGTRRSRFTKYAHSELVGLDEASTTRCVKTMSRYLVTSKNHCASRHAPTKQPGPHCTFGVYGGVRSPSTDKRILSRVRTLSRLRLRHSVKLSKTRLASGQKSSR